MSTKGRTWRYQPAGALCVRCHYRPARISAKFPDRATLYCSDHCREVAGRQRDQKRMRELADEVRRRIGLYDERGPHLTVPELEALVTHLQRLHGNRYTGLYHLPRSKRADGRYRRRTSSRRATR